MSLKKILKLNFVNGWTLSVAPDTDPACWNIMAWPTRQDNQPFDCLRFYVWEVHGEKQIDVRLWGISDLIDRLSEIGTAEPPPP